MNEKSDPFKGIMEEMNYPLPDDARKRLYYGQSQKPLNSIKPRVLPPVWNF